MPWKGLLALHSPGSLCFFLSLDGGHLPKEQLRVKGCRASVSPLRWGPVAPGWKLGVGTVGLHLASLTLSHVLLALPNLG